MTWFDGAVATEPAGHESSKRDGIAIVCDVCRLGTEFVSRAAAQRGGAEGNLPRLPHSDDERSRMTTALDILLTHRLANMGGAPWICVGANGHPTDCRWKARRRKTDPGYGTQHLQHLADLIDQAYAEPHALRHALRAVQDVLEDFEHPFPLTSDDIRASALHREISGCLQDLHDLEGATS